MPAGRVRCWKGPQVWTHRGEVRQLQRPPLRAGLGLPEEEGGTQRGREVEVSLPKWRQPAQAGQPEEPPTSAGGEKGGEMEVEEVRHESGSVEEMKE